ncbi:5'(3')-deoxyribonucleotidase, mitochondrial isoform X2 [Psammomys obesus]|uniref:5'(3')-deoxyribonucleotidase, mitochondrial isoform X2 n=1 Tax=Psammomys obesus TaxID=48139 RepID=UPI002452953C|nr:5'(3')-deoxyribonucleotidase, mitochondrial isoform X2 [Psammomys obesus]XP_055450127.1 5'(3')-deoxyribonucleotidase, mitochondrial isoform X2 [Psammomys obesus]
MLRLRGCCARPRGAPVRAERSRASSRALRVLVDMDGVLADFEGGFLRKFRARFPDLPFVALEDRRGFWVSEQYGRLQPGLSEKAISIWESKDFFFELEPLPGAVEAVKQMANLQNTDVFICTSPIKMFKYCPYEKQMGPGAAGVGRASAARSSPGEKAMNTKHANISSPGFHLPFPSVSLPAPGSPVSSPWPDPWR